MTAPKTGDYVMEYRRVDESGVEQVMAKYLINKNGSKVALVPVQTFFENHQLLDNLQYWIDRADRSGELFVDGSDVEQRSLLGDLQMLHFVLAAVSPDKAETERLAWEARGKT